MMVMVFSYHESIGLTVSEAVEEALGAQLAAEVSSQRLSMLWVLNFVASKIRMVHDGSTDD